MRRDVPVAGILSDLDGTLVDTKVANYHAYRVALEEVGVPFPWEVFETTWGQDSRDFVPRIAPSLSAEDVLEVRRLKAIRYSEFFSHTSLNEPLVALFESMAQCASVALVTTAKRQNALEILQHHGIDQLFDLVVCGEDTERSKPAPDPYLQALSVLELDPARCIAFEDSQSGIDSAVGAGIPVIQVRF